MSLVERPEMPSGYGIATDAGGELSWDWVSDKLAAGRNYWVCTTRADGRPHTMPVWGLWLDDALLFSTDPTSLKARNLAQRPDVVIHLESGDEVAIAVGRAERLAPDALPAQFVTAYDAKYGHTVDTSNPDFGFYRLRPDRILAWRERDFPTSATRFSPG
jgi:pyridoxine/pyridoxamine 5'-phosphate oxidase